MLQAALLLQREKALEVMDQHQSLFKRNDALNLIQAGQQASRINDPGSGPIDDAFDGIDQQRDRAQGGLGDNELVLSAQWAGRKPKAQAQIEGGYNFTGEINGTQHDRRSLGEGSRFNAGNYAMHLIQIQGIEKPI